jgi:hypothetical protein
MESPPSAYPGPIEIKQLITLTEIGNGLNASSQLHPRDHNKLTHAYA